jgi:hypothetical protein
MQLNTFNKKYIYDNMMYAMNNDKIDSPIIDVFDTVWFKEKTMCSARTSPISRSTERILMLSDAFSRTIIPKPWTKEQEAFIIESGVGLYQHIQKYNNIINWDDVWSKVYWYVADLIDQNFNNLFAIMNHTSHLKLEIPGEDQDKDHMIPRIFSVDLVEIAKPTIRLYKFIDDGTQTFIETRNI